MTYSLVDVARDDYGSPWLMLVAGLVALVALVLALVFLIQRFRR